MTNSFQKNYLATHYEPHEIEEVAALFHERSARASAETIPVPDLAEERKAVLANGEHMQLTNTAFLCLLYEPCNGRHVSVFHTTPE